MRYLQFPLLLSVMAATLAAGDFKIIANYSVTDSQVEASELKAVFLETRTSLQSGVHVEPVLLKSGPAHESFLKEQLGKTDGALEAYYRALVFTGRALMPKSAASDSEAVAYVAKTKGAIGYVSAGASTVGVKVLDVK